MNRRRLHDQDPPAVEYKEFPNPEIYADDFLFGFTVTDQEAIDAHKDRPSRRRSVLRMNMAVAVTPYHGNTTLHHAPRSVGPWQHPGARYRREVAYTAYQYPFALCLTDCMQGSGPEWTAALLDAIAELGNVAGGHTHSYFEMSPRTIIVRLTNSLVAGFDTYGFDENGRFRELTRVHGVDLPGNELWIAGALARDMSAEERNRFESEGVRFYESPQLLLSHLGRRLIEART